MVTISLNQVTLPNSIELSCRKPVIAAIHNACVGGGVDFITAADIRICTEDAYFQVIKLNYSTYVLMCGILFSNLRTVGAHLSSCLHFVPPV